MKLSEYAKEKGVCYKTAWRWWKQGLIKGEQLPTGTVILSPETKQILKAAAIYARVSSSQNKSNLDTQAKRLEDYAAAKGYQVVEVVKEIGSGLNDKRPKLLKLLGKDNYGLLIVEHSDRLTRFGSTYIEQHLNATNRKLEVVNQVSTDEEDLVQDFVSVITSFCARVYGKRRSKRNTEKLIKELQNDYDKRFDI